MLKFTGPRTSSGQRCHRAVQPWTAKCNLLHVSERQLGILHLKCAKSDTSNAVSLFVSVIHGGRHSIKADVNRIKCAKLTFSPKCKLSSLFKTSSLKPVITGRLRKGRLFIRVRTLDNLRLDFSWQMFRFAVLPYIWLPTCEGEAVTRLTPAIFCPPSLSLFQSSFPTPSPLIFFRLQTTVSLYASRPHQSPLHGVFQSTDLLHRSCPSLPEASA